MSSASITVFANQQLIVGSGRSWPDAPLRRHVNKLIMNLRRLYVESLKVDTGFPNVVILRP